MRLSPSPFRFCHLPFAICPFIFALLATQLSCDLDTPSRPWRDNPVDPSNPNTNGDPYHLQAILQDNGVFLSWDAVNLNGLLGYAVFRQVNNAEFDSLTSVDPQTTTYLDTAILPGMKYSYYIVVIGRDGLGASSHLTPVVVHSSPSLTIQQNAPSTRTRAVSLTIQAFDATQMRLSNNQAFIDALWEPYTISKSWLLETGAGRKTVYLQVRYPYDLESSVIHDTIEPLLPVEVGIDVVPDTTSRSIVRVRCQALNTDSMRLSLSPLMRNVPWIPFQANIEFDLVGGIPISVTPTKQAVRECQKVTRDVIPTKVGIQEFQYVREIPNFQVKSSEVYKSLFFLDSHFRGNDIAAKYGFSLKSEPDETEYTIYFQAKNDFEVPSEIVSDHVIASLRSSILINDGAETTTSRFINLRVNSPDAEEMALDTNRFDLESDPHWQPYTLFISRYELPTGPGEKTVYARFRNRVTESGIYNDSIDPEQLNSSILINNGAVETVTMNVHLDLYSAGAVAMKVSNHEIQANQPWVPFQSTLNWRLESGSGTKTVYACFRNNFLIEESVTAGIEPAEIDPEVNILPEDSLYLNHREIVLFMSGINALEMLIQETEQPMGNDWIPYGETFTYTVAPGDGWKSLYAWFRHDFFENGPAVDSFALDTHVSVQSFSWTSTGGEILLPGDEVTFELVLFDDLLGNETGGAAWVTVDGWESFGLIDRWNGTYSLTLEITKDTPRVRDAAATASFTDRAGNVHENVTAEGLLNIGKMFENYRESLDLIIKRE